MQESNQFSRREFFGLAGSLATFTALTMAGCGKVSATTDAADAAASTEAASTTVTGNITAVGSTALQPLVEAASEQFMEENPSVQITVQGGGSGQGITQIAAGSVQIGDSDVFAESKLTDKTALAKIADNKVCVVGMGPVVNSGVSVDDISTKDLKAIFMGQVTNWKDVGGKDLAITVINRASGSGTRATFEDAVFKGEKAPSTFTPQEQDSSGTVAKMVAETPGAISYLAFSYYSSSFKSLNVDGVKPKSENVTTNQWTIWAYEHMYTAVSPDAATKAFIDYIMSDEIQSSLVQDNGYISVADMKVSRDANGKVTTL